MAVSYGRIFFTYISLVFLVRYRICMMQCNPMPGPGMFPGDMGDIRFSASRNEASGSSNGRSGQLNMRQIRFLPSYQDFSEQPVGMPNVRTVTVINPQQEGSLQLHSISGSTVHFHASFFQLKVVPALGNTTFDIVFLARLVGNVENTLFIHTSKGVYPYQVFGVGVPNPFRLRPFLGARVPINFSFTSLINMHNPYGESLQIVEMYSSGGDLHLELPSGQEEAPQKHWEISPYETKALMRVSFLGRIASNHTAFVRIKTQPATMSELLILPVEVEVTAAPGLFLSVDLLDFGTLRTMDEPKSMGLYVMNSGPKQVHISSLTVEPPNSAVTFSFTPMVLKHGSKYVRVGSVTYSAYHAKRSRQRSGKIIVKTNSKSSPRLEIPYQANILQGTIAYSVSKTRFHVGMPPFEPVFSELLITNTFSFTMIIYDAAFPADVQDVFSIVNFTKPAKIQPQTTVAPFHVKFHANGSDLAFSTILKVYTNASIFTIPIHCYDGKLKHLVPENPEEAGVIDFGTVGTGENRSQFLHVTNANPVEVTLSKIKVLNVAFAQVIFMGTKPNNSSKQTPFEPLSSAEDMENNKITIKPGHTAFLCVKIIVPGQEGRFLGDINIITEYEILHIGLYLKVVDGNLKSSPSSLVFQPAFPGRIESAVLSLTSTFARPLKLVSLKPHPEDSRFYFVSLGGAVREILPNQEITVGELKFNPSLGCGKQCYTGLSAEHNGNSKWLSSVTFRHDVGDFDGQLIEEQREIFAGLEELGKTRLNVSFTLDTDVVKGVVLTTQASLTWPSLSPDKPIKFPLTHVGNYSVKFFVLENPADVPVVVHVVPLAEYPQFQRLWDVMEDRIDADTREFDQNEHSFVLPATATDKSENASFNGVTPLANDILGVTPAAGTLVTILKPRAKLKVKVHFQPKDEQPRTSLILIRNNLTVLDWIAVQGQGARGEFTLNNKRPGPHSTLLFKLEPIHLADCHKPVPRSHILPPLSVKKTLTAVNPGQLAIFVSSLSINGYECEGYGFKVMNCKSFILKPNTSRKIEIAFTPDFTMSRVTRKLEVRTTFGPMMEFTLVATIPSHLLPLCAAATGQSSWEPYLQSTALVVMAAILFFVLMSAYSEARKIVFLSQPQMQMLRWRQLQGEPNGEIFDLNAIARDESEKSPAKVHKVVPTKRLKKDTSYVKEPPVVVEKQSSVEQSPAASSTPSSSTNNNVNKQPNAAATARQDTVNKSKPNKTESAKNANESLDRGSKPFSAVSDSSDHTRKLTPPVKEAKAKISQETRVKPSTETSVCANVRRASDGKKLEAKAPESKETKITEVSLVPSPLSVELFSPKPEGSNKKENRESKAKLKKKSKAAARKEEKETKQALRIKGNKQQPQRQQREGDSTVSDGSASDASSEKSQPDRKGQRVTSESKKSRAEKEPASKSNTHEPQENGKTKNRRNAANKQPTETPSTTTRPKNLDVASGKSKAVVNNDSLTESRSGNFGATSPHAIAAAVMSLALEKSMQTSGKENNMEEQPVSQKKTCTKNVITALSPTSDSPPPTSPANLSGSSRSSSYSSIVSSDGVPTSELNKMVNGKSSKTKVKPSNSLPLGGRNAHPTFDLGHDDSRTTGQVAFQKPARGHELPSVRKTPWSISLDSALPPSASSSCNPISGRVPNSQFPPIVSSSLFESSPFTNNDGTVGRQAELRTKSMKNPFDLSNIDVTATGERNQFGQGKPASIWNGAQPSGEKRLPVESSSLFSSESPTIRRSNNWVNFLDAGGGNDLASQPAKSMSEIWDSGSSPSSGDGWAVFDSSQEVHPIGSEADAVDALFWQPPPDEWHAPHGPSLPQAAFVGQELPWTSPVWSDGPSSPESLPVISSPSFGFSGSSECSPTQTTPVTSAFGPLSGNDIWNPAPWSTCKD